MQCGASRSKASMTFARRIALLLLPSILLMAPPAQAAHIQFGTTLVCDTEQQVERFIDFYDGDTETAVEAVYAVVREPTSSALPETAHFPGTTPTATKTLLPTSRTPPAL